MTTSSPAPSSCGSSSCIWLRSAVGRRRAGGALWLRHARHPHLAGRLPASGCDWLSAGGAREGLTGFDNFITLTLLAAVRLSAPIGVGWRHAGALPGLTTSSPAPSSCGSPSGIWLRSAVGRRRAGGARWLRQLHHPQPAGRRPAYGSDWGRVAARGGLAGFDNFIICITPTTPTTPKPLPISPHPLSSHWQQRQLDSDGLPALLLLFRSSRDD